jgi:hypothetical protein
MIAVSIVGSYRYIMLCSEGVKVVPVDAVLTSWKLESNQVAFLYPPQNGYFTHPAMPRNGSGGKIFRISII